MCTTFRHRHHQRGRLIEIAVVEEEETEYGERKKWQVKSMRVELPRILLKTAGGKHKKLS
jgi:hypothetical protein